MSISNIDPVQQINAPIPKPRYGDPDLQAGRVCGVRWDRRVGRWGRLNNDRLCSFMFHFEYGVQLNCKLDRLPVTARGCSPSDVVGWSQGGLYVEEDARHLNGLEVLHARIMAFNGRDFYCGFRLVERSDALFFLRDGTCLALI